MLYTIMRHHVVREVIDDADTIMRHDVVGVVIYDVTKIFDYLCIVTALSAVCTCVGLTVPVIALAHPSVDHVDIRV